MRKYAAILCAVALMGGLCACKKADKPVDTKPTGTTTTTSAEANTNAKAPLNLTYASPFSDGVAFVRHTAADGTEQTVAINTAGDILFEVPTDMPIEGEGYKHGIRVVNNCIYDKTGALIASPEKSGYDLLMTGNCGGYVLAKKVAPVTQPAPAPENTANTTATVTDTTATGVTNANTQVPVTNAVHLSVGVLNHKGEWVHPLSTDHPIAQAMVAATQPAENFMLIAEGVLQIYVDTAAAPRYYHFADNTITDNYAHYESINYQDEDTGIYQVAADGNKKLVIKEVVSDYFFKSVFIGRTTQVDDEGEETAIVKLYDYAGKALADLTRHPTITKYFYVADRLLIQVDDGAGNRYLLVLGKDGKEIIEPVTLNLRDVVYTPDEAGFVIESHTAEGAVSYRHYDFVGNTTDYTDVTAFTGFSEGLAAVTLTDGTLCYINHKAEIVIK